MVVPFLQVVMSSFAKPFHCDKCPKSFATSSALSQHHAYHVGFPCAICNQRFEDGLARKNHIKTAHDGFAFRCTNCHKCFTQERRLKRHTEQKICLSVDTDQPFQPLASSTPKSLEPEVVVPSPPAPKKSKLEESKWPVVWENVGTGISEADIRRKFGEFGIVLDIHYVRPFATIYMSKASEMVAAFAELNDKVVWNQSMVLSLPKSEEPSSPFPKPYPSPVPTPREGRFHSEGQESTLRAELISGNKDEVLINRDGYTITRHDLCSLGGWVEEKRWINDNIMDYYFHLIRQRSKDLNVQGRDFQDWPTIHFFCTWFLARFQNQGYSAVKSWTKRVDIFTLDMVLIPTPLTLEGDISLHYTKSKHWCLIAIDLPRKTVTVYDSLKLTKAPGFFKRVFSYLQQEHLEKKRVKLNVSDWKKVEASGIPRQDPSDGNCGIFTARYAECLAANRGFNFSKEMMPSFRIMMILEIKKGHLKDESPILGNLK